MLCSLVGFESTESHELLSVFCHPSPCFLGATFICPWLLLCSLLTPYKALAHWSLPPVPSPIPHPTGLHLPIFSPPTFQSKTSQPSFWHMHNTDSQLISNLLSFPLSGQFDISPWMSNKKPQIYHRTRTFVSWLHHLFPGCLPHFGECHRLPGDARAKVYRDTLDCLWFLSDQFVNIQREAFLSQQIPHFNISSSPLNTPPA